MANKTIQELTSGTAGSSSDALIFETAGNVTKKMTWGDLVSQILTNHLAAGTNITFTQGSASGGLGNKVTISATDTTYTAGDGIDITANAISVKCGAGLSVNAQTGNIDAAAPTIDSTTKHWLIDGTDTGVIAEGQDGQDGAAATITVGTVTTGAAGTNASVTNSGTSSAAVFDFAIPRGADGSNGTNGTDGDDGYSISAAVTTITGGHRVTISSTDPNASDSSFDVMDGVTTIQTTSANSTATLAAASWSGASAPYSQTVTVAGMTASIIPVIGLSVSGTTSTGIEQQQQWSYVTRAESGANSVTFYCYENKPTVDLTVNIKAV